MNITILRHGTAEDRALGKPDADRRLTKDGKRELKAVLRIARRAGSAPDLILTSPLTRALETARVAETELECQQAVETKSLLPDAAPAQVWRELREHRGAKEIMLVGHEPQLSGLAAFLLDASLAIDLKKGALLRITVQDGQRPRGVLKWLLTPRLAAGK